MKYLDLKLGYNCNNNCMHCVISDQREKAIDLRGNSNRSTQECKDEILQSKNKGCSSVTITGGEPTLRKDFIEIARFAKDENLRVLLQSNGRAFSYKKFTQDASNYIDFFMIAIHSHNKNIHDKITQREGSFEQTIQGVKNLLNLNCDVGIKVVISKFNHNDLLKTIKFISSLGVKYANIAFPHFNGNAMKYFDEVAVRYKEIQHQILETINWAEDNKFNLDFEEILPCALDKEVSLKYFADLKIRKNQGEVKQLDSDTMDWNTVRATSKKKGTICTKCVFNNFCEGYWKEYIDKFGFGEFQPITKLPFEVKQMLLEKINTWK